jgi:hypothetical protein
MSFKKNLFTVLLAIVLVLLGCWLVGIERGAIIDGMTLVIATMVMTLLIEDFWRKALTTKELLTWQYFIGALLISGSVMAWLWASESTATQDMVVRLVATFLSGGLGGIWMAIPYRRSVEPEEDREDARVERYQAREEKKWLKWYEKIKKATPEDALNYLGAHLRFHPLGDNLDGPLDFAQPIAVVDEKVLTYEELVKSGASATVTNQVKDYLKTIVQGM